jgi:vacuole morphology and inheritance protein 14
MIFEGVATVLADTDDEVRDGAKLLDRLVKEIITECEEFSVEKFLPLLQNYIRRTNPYLRQLVVGWITVLDGIPDVCMIDYLPDFLDGLFNMLSDSNLEIRQAADSALNDFLREIRESAVLEFGPIVSILVYQCESKERLNRLTSVTWLSVRIHHPDSGGEKLLPFHAEVLGAILTCISDSEVEIRKVAERANSDLLALLRDTKNDFELEVLLETLIKEMSQKDDVPTKVAVLKWVNMLLEKRKRDIDVYIDRLMPPLLQLLKDQSDTVVLLTVQVLSRISLPQIASDGSKSKDSPRDEAQFEMVIKSILAVFNQDRNLLETRGSLIVRRLCVLLNAKSVYLVMADIISSYDVSPDSDDSFTLEFVATMVQTLNLILLTASELHNLRQLLEESFSRNTPVDDNQSSSLTSRAPSNRRNSGKYYAKNEGARVFASLFHCWSNNPVSTFSLCLLARAYDLAFALVKKFSELEITVGFLMQIDKLIHLIESPIFVHTRLQLLDAEAPYHTYLLKSLYGLLMLLPQSDAFHALNDRLTSICNLRDNLGIRPSITASPATGVIKNEESSIYESGLHALDLLDRFDEVMSLHRKVRTAIQQKSILPKEKGHVNHVPRPGPQLQPDQLAGATALATSSMRQR